MFFRLELLNRNKNTSYFESNDEDEDLAWEADEELVDHPTRHDSVQSIASMAEGGTPVSNEERQRIAGLENENDQLKRQVALLLKRVADLELELSKVKQQSSVPASVTATVSAVSVAAEVHEQNTLRKASPESSGSESSISSSSMVRVGSSVNSSPILVSPVTSPKANSSSGQQQQSSPARSTTHPASITPANATASSTAVPPKSTTTAATGTATTNHQKTSSLLFELNEEEDDDGWT